MNCVLNFNWFCFDILGLLIVGYMIFIVVKGFNKSDEIIVLCGYWLIFFVYWDI